MLGDEGGDAAQRRLLADHPRLQRMPVLCLAQSLRPGVPDPPAVGRQILDVPAPEVAGDLVERAAALGGVAVRINDPDCVAKTFPDYFQVLAGLSS